MNPTHTHTYDKHVGNGVYIILLYRTHFFLFPQDYYFFIFFPLKMCTWLGACFMDATLCGW